MANRIILSEDLGKEMVKAGIVPGECRRMIIDINWSESPTAVSVYYDCLGDERLLEMDLPGKIKAAIRTENKEGD